MFRKRGQQRWSALVSACTSRIARAMREHLGKARWHSFVAYAEARYKEQFVSAFEPDSGVIACAGPIEGGPCPRAFEVHVDDPGACELLESLHLDHTHDVGNVCSVWRASVPKAARGWSAGIERARLCRALRRNACGRPGAMSPLQVRLEPWSRRPTRRAPLPLAASALRAFRLGSPQSVRALLCCRAARCCRSPPQSS
jgi:hypothetical protein